MEHEQRIKIIGGYLKHVVAMLLILVFVGLLVASAFNKDITVPEILISLGSGAVGFYLRGLDEKGSPV